MKLIGAKLKLTNLNSSREREGEDDNGPLRYDLKLEGPISVEDCKGLFSDVISHALLLEILFTEDGDLKTRGECDMNLTQVIYRVIDTETTGLAPPAAAICEVAFRDMRYDGRALGDFQTLCNPGHPIPPGAQAIHHISDEDVADKPKWIDVRPHCLAGISKTEMVYVAHNAPFDRAFLCIDGAWLDTLKIAKHLWPESGHKNDELRYFLKLKPDLVKDSPSHRAMNDVAVTAAILIHAFSVIAERHPEIETVEQLVKWSERPCLLLRVPFKNKGSPLFTEADLGLLQWIISRNAGGEDVIYSAKHELKRRAGTPQ